MFGRRHRSVLLAVAALVLTWVVAVAGYRLVQTVKVTPDKVRAYTTSLDLSRLSGADRAAAIQKLADLLNQLTLDERQGLRLDHTAAKWFGQMTDAEKAAFLQATLPTGFKQMITAFENLPADKRQRVISQAVKQVRQQREQMVATGHLPPQDTNGMVLSPELQDQVAKIGLQSFYSQSSAQTKAELAPFLEEVQHTMESSRMLLHQQ